MRANNRRGIYSFALRQDGRDTRHMVCRISYQIIIERRPVIMDPHLLTVAQLKNILCQRGLAIAGRKAELVLRMQQHDPSGAWIEEAAKHGDVMEKNGEDLQEDHAIPQEQEAALFIAKNELRQKEIALRLKKQELMKKEIDLLCRENDMLRISPRSVSSTSSRTTMNIKNISELLSEFHGSNDDFEHWKSQINLLRDAYELDENSAKIIVSSRLNGKAREWYYSLAGNRTLQVDEFLEKMDVMFNQLMGQLERRRQFEARGWNRTETLSEYCYDKLILRNRVPVTEEEMVDYIIEGIPSKDLRNQAQMHSFKTAQDLIRGFRKVKLKTPDTMVFRHT